MHDSPISFEQLDVQVSGLDLDLVRAWLLEVISLEKVSVSSLLYIFCTDAYLHELNKTHLNHDTYTDVITFPDSYDPISAEIYISIDRVSENAKLHSDGETHRELCRIILHGFLHMCKYDDKTPIEKIAMRAKEDHYLTTLPLNL